MWKSVLFAIERFISMRESNWGKAVPLAFSMRFTDIGLSMPDLGSSTNASVKSYQLVKVVSGGRAPGKSSSLASPQLLVIERFHCFGAVRLETLQFLYATAFGTCI